MIFALLMRTPLLSLFLIAAVPTAPENRGSVSGQVVLSAGATARTDASNAVVWIEGAHRPAGSAPAPAAVPQMRSDQKRFQPRVVVVPKSASVDFPNVDAIYHNVFSVSGSNRFDLGLYRSGASKRKEFDEPGLVRVFCNIHPQMIGFVFVVDSDFAATTGPDGKFNFEGVPAGDWTLKVWHEEAAAPASIPFVVGARGDAPPVAVRLDVTGFKSEPHKNKYGKDYPPQPATEDERY
jgi:plastocyanin